MAFPCDQFLTQEPGTNRDIKKLIREKFSAEFPIMEKSMINGADTCEIYRFLRYNTEALYDPENDIVQEIPWNFTKFLIDGSTGQVVTFNVPRISPLQLRPEIEAIIKKNSNKPFAPIDMDFGGKTLS